MPNVNFYLKKPESTLGKSLIYLQFKYHGKKLVYSFGQKISPLDWSKENKRVKSHRGTILNGQYAINDLLDKLEKICLKAYNEEMVKGIPPVSVLKFHMDAFMRSHGGKTALIDVYQLFDRFIAGEIKSGGREKSRNTLKNYVTTKGHLFKFDIISRYLINFENINLDFFQKYCSFLQHNLKLKPNSIARDIGVLKTVMSEAVDRGYTTNIQWRHKKFAFREEETGAVFLNEKEIAALYRLDLSSNRRLDQVRDLFVFGCLTGARLSRAALIGPENIVEKGGAPFLEVLTAQPRDRISIPCDPRVREVFEKYQNLPGHLPKAPSNQKFNDYIKEVCRLAGLYARGRYTPDPDRELWHCVSSSTACRSFATHYYLDGFPVIDLMKVTGHETEKAFLKYIRASSLKDERLSGQALA